MTIQLTLEDEKLIQKRLEAGPFHTIEDVIHDALASQDSEAEWLASNKVEIGEKIARGIDQLDRGEGVPGEVARARLQQRKAEWLSERPRG